MPGKCLGSTCNPCREELGKTHTAGCSERQITRSHDPWTKGNACGPCGLHNFWVVTRRETETGTRGDGAIKIIEIEDSARTDAEFRACVTDRCKHISGGWSAERDLGNWKSALQERIGKRHGIFGALYCDHRHDAETGNDVDRIGHLAYPLFPFTLFCA